MAAAATLGGAFLMRGELATWVQHVPSGPAIAALFRSVPMPGGPVPVLSPPAEARPRLARMIAAAPRETMLYRLRAHEDELALDFTAAEADWKAYGDPIELADFYHRRMRPRDELAALGAAAEANDDPLLPLSAQRGWRAFERMAALATGEDLPPAVAEPVFRAWAARYPKERAAWRNLIEYLSAHSQYAAAEAEIASYRQAFQDDFEPVRMRATLELRRDSAEAALAVYDRAFQPLWPEELRASYFKLLETQGQLREFAGRARTALAANPADLDATARLFHYFKSQNNVSAAGRVLLEYRLAKESANGTGQQPWNANELETLAQLFEWLPDVNEAARAYHALYSVSPADGPRAERALYGLANLLLAAPDQPIQFGSGDLSFYTDVATVDPSPGFLNGILSLLLNSTGPRREYRSENQKSAAYFHRAAASQLVSLLEQRFPQSNYREVLRAELISAYAAYGDDQTVIRAGREYLAAFPAGAGRVPVALQISDALARANRTTEEFALYEALLREVAGKASGVPLGPNADARSAAYAQVLDKYLSRLAALHRPLEALRVYRAEIDRNPNDPGLYQRLAAFLEQNRMAREVEEVYTQAIAKFADPSWYDKLARWYIRRRQYSDVEKISRGAIAVFSGTELERYFQDVVTQTHPDAVLYRQLNLYAHERFPEDLAFVHNLLGAYARKETYDAAAADRLLRQYWMYDRMCHDMLFDHLSARGRLYAELTEVRAANAGIVNGRLDQALAANPAAVQFSTEAEIWLSHFEAAAPGARALAAAYPGRRDFTNQASALYRSLAAYDPLDTEIAAKLAGDEHLADPRDTATLARIGDIFADHDLFARARPYWERMPATQPGKPEGYLDTATVYWDYYRYNDALRWIAAARRKFHDAALYAYQAGAIYEGKRNDAEAVREYVAGAVHGEMAAQNRLIRLLNRPATRDLVNRATAAAVAGAVASDPAPNAVKLRVAVLEAQQRRPELAALLESRVEAEKSSIALGELQETARRLGFDSIEERASARMAGIASDPVDKMRLTLAYVRLLEAKKDIAGASRVADALYRAHPLILGAIRGAVDFHVRNKQPDEGIGILLDAAKHARVDLASQFTLESARIATGAGEIERARTLLAGLLSADPFRAEYLAAMADTYIQTKDDSGFRGYQLATLERLKTSPLTPLERTARITAIRRSLIPALDRLKDSAGAVDQYIEIINNYPEDDALTKEAAAYAAAHGQVARMAAFYRKTVADSPRDYRWPIVLARIETVTEDFPAAIADYERAIKARPDRADIFEAKARLEERLMRFEDAIKTYGRLYELSYRDAQWMTKVAELQARSGQAAEAVSALKTAIIGARSETADADFAIAERLESWHILKDAVDFAEKGAALEGGEFFKDFRHALIYARIMARARRMDAVLSVEIGTEAAAPVTQAAGGIIEETYAPEEKARFEEALTARAAELDPAAWEANLPELAASAGLADLEARWRLARMSAQDQQIDPRFVELQSQRGLYIQLGRELEKYGAQHHGQAIAAGALTQAAQAFITGGDIEDQLRVMGEAMTHNGLSGDLLERYLALLARRRPDELLSIIRGKASNQVRNLAVQAAISSDRPELAYSAVAARGGVPPVWTRAYSALAGQYFNDRSPAIDASFQAALDTRTIGERLRAPLKPNEVITGAVWFYYGARYGDYLATGGKAEAEWWLPAYVEAAPGNAGAYMALGDAYAAGGQRGKAISQFEHALELDANRGDAYDHIARALWAEGRRPEAIAHWKSALAAYLRIQSRGVRVPESFWRWEAETLTDIGERRVFGELRGEIAHLLGDYYQRNKGYRLSELIEPAAQASLTSGEGIGWLVDLARSTDETDIIPAMPNVDLTDAQRIALARAQVELSSARAAASFGDDREWRANEATAHRLQLISMLLDAGDVQGALREWSLVPPTRAARTRWDNGQLRDEVEIGLASKTGGLAALLERYRAQPEFAPPMESLRSAAMALQAASDESSARTVLEFLYVREIRNGDLSPAYFLGLAEVKLERNDSAAAAALLNRMTLLAEVAEDGFESLLPAAELLNKYGKSAEAADFIRRRIKAVPWDADAKLQLARTLPTGAAERRSLLGAVVGDTQAPYKLRAEAARLAAPQPFAELGGTELALLSSATITPAAADKPFQVEARLQAAREVSDAAMKLRLSLEALAIAPADGRVRLSALRAAIAEHRDHLALALAQNGAPLPDTHGLRRRYYQPPVAATILPEMQLTNEERRELAEALAASAERVEDLNTVAAYLRAAIALLPQEQRAALDRHLKAIVAELDRRAKNVARQPVIRDAIEQEQIVGPRIAKGSGL